MKSINKNKRYHQLEIIIVNGKTITSTILNKTMDMRKENTLTK